VHAFLISLAAVGLGEVGDKTQLLVIMLAARYRQPWVILAGVLVATLASLGLAALAGDWVHGLLTPELLRWGVGLSLLAVAAWTLRPEKPETAKADIDGRRLFWITVVSFFVAEIGDKTQIATALLAARYGELVPVAAGATLGIMFANTPAAFFGHRVGERLSLAWLRGAAAVLFAAQGVLMLMGYGAQLG
jgi:Ca2+/H+ antiporter, TMEM165/GDT1 family